MKHIKDYLHLYLGCEMKGSDGDTYTLAAHNLPDALIDEDKPILRPLWSMTKKELIRIEKLLPSDDSIDDEDAVEMLKSTGFLAKKLLEMRFDLFNLIEENLAIDATKPNSEPAAQESDTTNE